jgi:nucleotidyltransferase substrate binding protein (TIGR01987 family)
VVDSLDVRWKQRFSNYQRALQQLQEFVEKKPLSKLEQQGLIKTFEYTYELAWNTMKDFYEAQGEVNIQGSKDAIRLSFKRGLIKNGEQWMSMVQSRIETAHTYNEETANRVVLLIVEIYYQLFIDFRAELTQV